MSNSVRVHWLAPNIFHSQNAVEDVIHTMDEYYLSREDWDTIVELGVDDRRDELVLKKIPTAVKTTFTRKYAVFQRRLEWNSNDCYFRYNTSDHPIPFHKAQDLGKPPKKLAAEAVPDLEEAYDVSLWIPWLMLGVNLLFQLDEAIDEGSDDEKSGKNPDDIANDKLIKAPKKKANVKAASTKTTNAKTTKRKKWQPVVK